jgi:hypothetical protein
MTRIAHPLCANCGAPIPAGSISVNFQEDEGVLFVRYDKAYIKKVVLIDAQSGLRQPVDFSSKQAPETASRQIGGIIGPY